MRTEEMGSKYMDPEENILPVNHAEYDTQDDDSDVKQLFELPKRKVIRQPVNSFSKRNFTKSHCFGYTGERIKRCCVWVAPLFVALFIVSTCLCMMFLLSGVAGMREEMDVIKVKLKNAAAIETDFNTKREKLQKELSLTLHLIDSHKNVLKKYSDDIKKVTWKVNSLNRTIAEIQKSSGFVLSNHISVIKADIGTLKMGMADTGSDIEKLKGRDATMETDMRLANEKLMIIQKEMFNISHYILNVDKQAEFTSTPKTLVVEITPDKDRPLTRKEFDDEMEELQLEHKQLCLNETQTFGQILRQHKKTYEQVLHMLDKSTNQTLKSSHVTHSPPVEMESGGPEKKSLEAGPLLPNNQSSHISTKKPIPTPAAVTPMSTESKIGILPETHTFTVPKTELPVSDENYDENLLRSLVGGLRNEEERQPVDSSDKMKALNLLSDLINQQENENEVNDEDYGDESY